MKCVGLTLGLPREPYAGKEEEFLLIEIAFTKRYLERHAFIDIWRAMGTYNNAVGEAALHPRIEAVDRAAAPLVSLEGVVPVAVGHSDCVRTIMDSAVAKWSSVVGPECASRLSKRTGTREDWGARPIAILLALGLIERLSWKIGLGSQIFKGVEAIINRLYNDSKAVIESVTLRA